MGATIVGVSAAVGKAISKSSMPPSLQKAGLILGASLIGGIGHSTITAANRDAVRAENAINSVSNTNIGSDVSKLVNDSHISPLQELLFNGEAINYVCLSIIYIMILQLIFKLY